MKILYVTQMYPSKDLPQYCIFLHQQVKALLDNNVEVQIVVPTTARESGLEEFDGVKILYLQYRDFSRTILYPFVCRKLRKECTHFVNISNFDLIYAIHSPANVLEFSRKLAKRWKKPLVVHYRGYNIFDEYMAQKKVLFSNVEKVQERVVRDSALSIGVSRKTGQIITDRFPDASVATVYNGVNTSLFTDSGRQASRDKVKLLCVANLIPIKGHKFLFNALKKIQEKYPDKSISLDLVGRGGYESELKNYVQTHGVRNISFHGYVHYDKVAEFMQEADIFVLPSIYESFGNVCMEAMASKKPVVIFEGQGIDELVEDGHSAMVATKGDTEELFCKIEQLIVDISLREKIAEEGYRIAQKYSWDYSAKMIIKNIEGLIDNEN